MKFDGMKFTRRPDLAFRYARDGGHTYTDGSHVAVNHVVFFSLKTGTELALEFHGLTSMAYGPERTGADGFRRRTVYLAKDGRVYSTGLVRKLRTDERYEVGKIYDLHFEQNEMVKIVRDGLTSNKPSLTTRLIGSAGVMDARLYPRSLTIRLTMSSRVEPNRAWEEVDRVITDYLEDK